MADAQNSKFSFFSFLSFVFHPFNISRAHKSNNLEVGDLWDIVELHNGIQYI